MVDIEFPKSAHDAHGLAGGHELKVPACLSNRTSPLAATSPLQPKL